MSCCQILKQSAETDQTIDGLKYHKKTALAAMHGPQSLVRFGDYVR